MIDLHIEAEDLRVGDLAGLNCGDKTVFDVITAIGKPNSEGIFILSFKERMKEATHLSSSFFIRRKENVFKPGDNILLSLEERFCDYVYINPKLTKSTLAKGIHVSVTGTVGECIHLHQKLGVKIVISNSYDIHFFDVQHLVSINTKLKTKMVY